MPRLQQWTNHARICTLRKFDTLRHYWEWVIRERTPTTAGRRGYPGCFRIGRETTGLLGEARLAFLLAPSLPAPSHCLNARQKILG